jgi:hypothetical protein
MLIERITNPWYLFRILLPTLEGVERGNLAKQAFLHVICSYSAYKSIKELMLGDIAKACPEITDIVSDEEMQMQFQDFCQEARRRREFVSPAELEWVYEFVKSSAIRTQVEKLIYKMGLLASSSWDSTRRAFSWTISESEKLELVREVLRGEEIGSIRKVELAEEFGEPKDDFVRFYYRKLLYDRHYDKAKKLGVSYPDVVVDVIVENINNGYLQGALDIAQHFLPERADLIDEIKEFMTALN